MNKQKFTIILIILTLIGGVFLVNSALTSTIDITVTGKEVKRTNDKDTYLIFADIENSDKTEVFKIEDSLIFFSFDSSDKYAKLKEGETYTVKVYGMRIKFMSQYRNIVKIY